MSYYRRRLKPTTPPADYIPDEERRRRELALRAHRIVLAGAQGIDENVLVCEKGGRLMAVQIDHARCRR